LESLDDLAPEKIQDHIAYAKTLLAEISSLQADDLETEIDRHLIELSLKNFLREFDEIRIWKCDPTLYIKIPLFAIDHILSHPRKGKKRISQALLSILSQIPPFLTRALENLSFPSVMSLRVAVPMARDAARYHRHEIADYISVYLDNHESIHSMNMEVVEAWGYYGEGLSRLSSTSGFAVGEKGLQKIIWGLGYPKSPGEVLEMAREAYEGTLATLQESALGIDKRKTWQELIYEGAPPITTEKEVLTLYRNEVETLRRFFREQQVMAFPYEDRIAVVQTPSYLRSLRATASYKAPLTGDKEGHGIFYITPGTEDLPVIASHCPYLTAHETYPGHHILDHVRIHHGNPIRRQIESPLFYEGWACYAEQLLDELDYIQNPRQRLVQLKRRLWRDLRAILDVRLQTEEMSPDEAKEEIIALGFSQERAHKQVVRFSLTPGYQLCYFTGMYEINRLRAKHSEKLSLKSFHDILLGGGEIPFHCVKKRLER
jgi:hypothetical protein